MQPSDHAQRKTHDGADRRGKPIGSVTQMRELVRAAVGGVAIRHVTTLPPQMPAFHELTYFQFDQSGPEWRDIASTAPAMGFAIAGDWPELKIEAWAVKRSGP